MTKRKQIPQSGAYCKTCPCADRNTDTCRLYGQKIGTVRLPICIEQKPFIGAWKEVK